MRRRAEFEKLLIPKKKERSEFWDFRSSGCCLFVVREVDLEVEFPLPVDNSGRCTSVKPYF
jgi:hypothetical protein